MFGLCGIVTRVIIMATYGAQKMAVKLRQKEWECELGEQNKAIPNDMSFFRRSIEANSSKNVT